MPRHLNEQHSLSFEQLEPTWTQLHAGLEAQLESPQSTAWSQSLSSPSSQISAGGAPQSAGQLQRSSSAVQEPSPHTGGGGGGPQSISQLLLFSTPEHVASPQQDGVVIVVVQLVPPLPQRASAQPTAPVPPKPQQ